jgi:hypothetical protein
LVFIFRITFSPILPLDYSILAPSLFRADKR